MNGHLVGHWSIGTSGHTFAYHHEWLDNPFCRAISLSMPLRGPAAPYRGAIVENFFDNLLPDSQLVRTQLQRRLGIPSKDTLSLLAHLGSDCLGALQILPHGQEPSHPNQIQGIPLTEAQIAQILRDLPRYPLGITTDSHIRLSLAGNHEKTALLRQQDQWLMPLGATPTTHILKLPIGVTKEGLDLSLSVENEWLCHRILQLYDLPVASAEIGIFEEQKCLIVTRFDRVPSPANAILRLPHEDFCQATGTPSAFKYENDGGPGIKDCLALLSGSQKPEIDKEIFFKAQVLYWLLCAIDGHAKNFSLALGPQGRFRLAPLYDVLSAYPVLGHGKGKISRRGATMAMAVWGKNRHYHWDQIAKRHWLSTAQSCSIPYIDEILETFSQKTPAVVSSISGELPKDFPAHISEPILEGLLKASQRL